VRNFGHSLTLGPDYSFRVDEVQPGRYELVAQVRGERGGKNELLAEIRYEFGVAPKSSQVNGPVDLGTVTLKRIEP
jgi:hypothetical protein